MLLVLLPLLLYGLFLCMCLWTWHRTKSDTIADNLHVGLSVVICARNEENAIGGVLQDVCGQLYPAREIIVVDDGSIDRTADIVRTFVGVKLISTSGIGKKKALYQAVESATCEYVVCVDADCHIPGNWLLSVATCIQNYHPALIIAPVRMESGTSLFGQLQALEFMSLVAVTAGAATAGHPVMCNGANLAFRRDIWLGSFSEIHIEEASGDDMFFLISCKRHRHSIRYLKAQDSIVSVKICDTLSQFVAQRRRWVSKGKSYSDKEILLLAGLTWWVTLLPLFLILFHWQVALWVWGVKTIADFYFLKRFAAFFQTKVSVALVLILALIYPFYVGFVSVSALFKSTHWK